MCPRSVCGSRATPSFVVKPFHQNIMVFSFSSVFMYLPVSRLSGVAVPVLTPSIPRFLTLFLFFSTPCAPVQASTCASLFFTAKSDVLIFVFDLSVPSFVPSSRVCFFEPVIPHCRFVRNPDKYRSVSAFSAICNPVECPWGKKAFSGYLGKDEAAWKVRAREGAGTAVGVFCFVLMLRLHRFLLSVARS